MSPSRLLSPGRAAACAPLPETSSMAPMALAQTPMIFFPVTISRRTNAARIMVNTGVMVVMMAASAGEVNPTPTVKAIWLKMIPNREA